MSAADSTPTGDHLVRVADAIADGLLDRTLAKTRWTHEGHLLACVALVRRLGPTDALALLRAAIPPYNVATGVANTTTGGYHDTITVYFVWAVARLLDDRLSTTEILWHPTVERDALLAWWKRETLFSPAARLGWCPPALAGDDGSAPKEWLQPESIKV